MEINFRDHSGWIIMDISGHIKGNEVSQFRKATQACREENKVNLVANMSNVGFIDSSGVGMLITCHQDLKSEGGKLVLMNLSDDIYDLFEMTSIDRLFEIVEAEKDLPSLF